VIDALDESLDRHRLLRALRRIIDNDEFANLRILAASRKEVDIQKVFEDITPGMSLSNPYVEADINVYVHSELRSNINFGNWPEALKTEVEAALVKGAKGM
jgi:hypothetical protein